MKKYRGEKMFGLFCRLHMANTTMVLVYSLWVRVTPTNAFVAHTS